ncbi:MULTISPECIES: DEAD/DEAH box helicase [Dietzia]|uniref:DEAD/DEAH box helicase n=1 Tax=Dietzia TaxID=37914 RepID=UPI0020C47DFE|nr:MULTISPECIES: DEAD/DEAH box helicase [Dietzia]MCT1710986.1 DEAD/DEAH box helicase [Dietzia cinnamea]MCT2273536.1 DEAD/DEAH box helicase [Dietzia cinnamea]
MWQSGVVGLWCETGLRRPGSIAPAASVTAVARAGAPPEVVELLDGFSLTHRIVVRVPLEGRVRAATVPGIRVSVASAVDLCGMADVAEHWVGPGLRALAALSAGVAAFVRAGHVVPTMSRSDGAWNASWALAASPVVSAWAAESLSRCHGLVSDREDLDRLLAALADQHARMSLAPLAADRRSALGTALIVGGEVTSGGHALAEAIGEFGRAAAARDVEVVFRVVEPSGEVDVDRDGDGDAGRDGAADAEVLWRLEVLVRTGTDTLRPFSDLPDATAVGDAVRDVVDRAVRCWTPLGRAVPAADGPDLLLPTELVVQLVDEGVEALRGRGVEVLLPRAWTRVRTAVRVIVAEPGTENIDSGRRLGLDQLADVNWEMVVDDVPLDATEVRMLLDAASDLVRLRGQWVRADPGALRRAARFLAARRGGRVTAPALAAAMMSEEAEGVEIEAPTTLDWIPSSSMPVDLPAWFLATLRPYQLEGVRWLSALARAGVGAVLADDMGLGKTMQVLALTASERARGVLGPTLVVAPLTLVATWAREAATFAPELMVRIHHGPSRERGDDAAGLLGAADLVLTSYGTASRDAELLAAVPWRRLVADEAQTIKNPSTSVARAIVSIPAEHRIALTGTPVENRLDELRAVLDFANPGLLGSAGTFRARFAVPIESHRDQAAASRLRALAAPFVLRRLKSDPRVLADLPDKLHIRVDAPLTREQATLYQAVVEDMMEQVKESEGTARKGAILAGLTALKQVCNHPAHYLGDGSALLRGGRHRSGKLAALDEVLTEILDAGEKVLLFTQYRAFGDLILPLLERRAASSVPFLHGGVTAAGRAQMVEEFQSAQGPPVMLASLRAGGTGLTLTEANHVVHLDRWWNPAVENQATDRVHRIGQTRQVQVRTLVAPGTVEDRIDELLEAKRDLAELTLGPLAGALTELADADLAALVELTDEGRDEE